jgi:hypothetical protein
MGSSFFGSRATRASGSTLNRTDYSCAECTQSEWNAKNECVCERCSASKRHERAQAAMLSFHSSAMRLAEQRQEQQLQPPPQQPQRRFSTVRPFSHNVSKRCAPGRSLRMELYLRYAP